MSDTYNIGPTVPALFRAHEERYQEAQKELARLRAELLRVTELETAIEVRDDEITQLRAENAELRADAERYRWLRAGYDGSRTRSRDVFACNAAGIHVHLDDAIDAARKEESK